MAPSICIINDHHYPGKGANTINVMRTAADRLRELPTDKKLAATKGTSLRTSQLFTTGTERGARIYRFLRQRLEGRANKRHRKDIRRARIEDSFQWGRVAREQRRLSRR